MFQDNVDLTNCDRERVHLISRIQGHGAFVAFSARDFKIQNVSGNLATILGREGRADVFVGKILSEILGVEDLNLLKGIIRGAPERESLAQDLLLGRQDQRFDAYLYSIGEDIFGLELTPFDGESFSERFRLLNDELEGLKKAQSLDTLSRLAAKAIRRLAGFERVMVYRFFPPSMYGEVIGEDRTAEAHSFLNHRFPATDIPKPARDLYLKNKIRFIFDSLEDNFEVLPKAKSPSGLIDMSDSRLRGSSLIHLEYLKNMGVRTSCSFAIIVDEKLWGIVACHHPEPLYVTHKIRSLCLSVAHVFSQVAPLLEERRDANEELDFYRSLHSLYGELRRSNDPLDHLFRNSSSVLKLFSASGIAFVSEEKIDVAGTTPRLKDLKEFAGWIREQMEGSHTSIFETDNLSKLGGKFDYGIDLSGVLAVRTSETGSGLLILLRPEITRTIQWGGDPKKTLSARQYGGEINPRQSFETWNETVRGHSLPWQTHHLRGIENFKDLLFETLINREKLIQELSERSKKN